MSKLSSEELEFQNKFEKRILCDSEYQTQPEKVRYSFKIKELLEEHYDFHLEGTITTAYPMKQERVMELSYDALRNALCFPSPLIDDLGNRVRRDQHAIVVAAIGHAGSGWHVHWWAHLEKCVVNKDEVLKKLHGNYRYTDRDGKRKRPSANRGIGNCDVRYYGVANPQYPVYGIANHQDWIVWDMCTHKGKNSCRKRKCQYRHTKAELEK